MKERKNIDRLFQEKFKDFEAYPSDRVWENILSTKAKKENRRIMPLWLRLGGVAAALAILFTVGSFFWSTPENDTQLVDTKTPIQTEETDSEANPVKTNTEKEILENSNNVQSPQFAEKSTNDNTVSPLGNEGPTQNGRTGVPENGTSNTKSHSTIAQLTENATKTTRKNQRSVETPGVFENATIVDAGNIATSRTDKNTPEGNDRSVLIDPSKSDVNTTSSKTQDAIVQEVIDQEKLEEKKSLVDVAEAIQNAKEEEVVDVNDRSNYDRWNVGAVAAPVYYGDFGGSGIDPQFKDNTKSGDVNLSYGVQVSYAVSDKLKVRTGVNNVDLSYGTNDISFSPDIAASRLAGVAYNSNGKFLSVTDRIGPNELAQSDFQGGGSNISNGSINQKVGYIEVPVEAVYVISDKRLGVEVIGGVSTLFVNDNEIAIESEGLRTPIGESSSLNDISFTTNVGIGLNYKVTESVHINMEPTLKYQLNAFDNSAGNFKPYYVGLYTGVSYRF